MSFFGRILRRKREPERGYFRNLGRPRGESAETEEGTPQTHTVRRWEAMTATHRLNEAHWKYALGKTITQALVDSALKLRQRAEYELSVNPDLEGLVNTFVTDVVGETGPALQVISEDPDYNNGLERVWTDWWAPIALTGDNGPDLAGKLAGIDLLALWVRGLFPAGEFIVQLVDPSAPSNGRERGISLRLHTIHPVRLGTPATRTGVEGITMGVKRDRYGKPLAYMIDDTPETETSLGMLGTEHKEVKAKDVVHVFETLEPGQARGVPWLVTVLPVAAAMADYDEAVLTAAQEAAKQGVLLHTNHADAKFVEVEEETTLEGGSMRTLPPGYLASQMTPSQPSTQYPQFHDELLRKLGRGRCMPLIVVKADARHHNYSSARFDGQTYQRSVRRVQGWLARMILNRLVAIVAREAELLPGMKLGSAPDGVKYQWNWPKAPHVDPQKEAKASTERLNNHTSTLRDECAALGTHWEDQLDQEAQEREARSARNLPQVDSQSKGRRGARGRKTDDEENVETSKRRNVKMAV